MNKTSTSIHSNNHWPGFPAYLEGISREPLLNREAELQLATVMRDQPNTAAAAAAREKLITSNLRLVVSIARNHATRAHPIEDLIAAGNVGLLTAVKLFKPWQFACRFSTYATNWIKQAVWQQLDAARLVHIPTRRAAQMRRIAAANSFQEWEYQQNADQLAKETGLPKATVEHCLAHPCQVVSLDGVCNEGVSPQTVLSEIADPHAVPPDRNLIAKEEATLLREGIESVLVFREAVIIKSRYGFGGPELTLQELAAKLGVSSETVRNLQRSALEKLRRHLGRRSSAPAERPTNHGPGNAKATDPEPLATR